MTQTVIDPRFNGLPDIALGGYVGGILARDRSKAEVTLRRPVRLATPYELSESPDGFFALSDREGILASSRPAEADLEAIPPVGLPESERASEAYPGFLKHLIPRCFVCGPGRAAGDGLRIFPGPVSGRDAVAAPWVPTGSLADLNGIVRPEYVWSSLDCPTIWALMLQSRPEDETRAVTAKLAVEHIAPVRADRPHVVVGWKVGETEKSLVSGGAIYANDGKLLARARHVLVKTNWGVPLGLDAWR